jgi:hypothetical protein
MVLATDGGDGNLDGSTAEGKVVVEGSVLVMLGNFGCVGDAILS